VAGVGLQRGQDLVQLHRRAGVLDLDRVAVAELGRARRARVDVDEEVALEEDPGTDRRVASMWIGRPLSSISIETTAPWLTPLPIGLTSVTLPTLTPAIRTKESGLMLLADLNAASSVKWCWNGIAFVSPK